MNKELQQKIGVIPFNPFHVGRTFLLNIPCYQFPSEEKMLISQYDWTTDQDLRPQNLWFVFCEKTINRTEYRFTIRVSGKMLHQEYAGKYLLEKVNSNIDKFVKQNQQ